jgi:site-specific DNA-cytosine methylase
MKVLVAFEQSGVVREAFRARGHDAWSCDLLPADEWSEFHHEGDAFEMIDRGGWDLIIAHPPCTHLCVAGNRWHAGTAARRQAVAFVRYLAMELTLKSKSWAIENPVGVLSSQWRKPTQYVQPWQFGHGETKKTGLWLHNLPKLVPTDVVEGREQRIWKMGPSPDRAKIRSRTYPGIANAMADAWSIESD